MEKWQNKVAVVTGASVGIGLSLCQDLVQAGMIVCGMSKRKDKMEVSNLGDDFMWCDKEWGDIALLQGGWEVEKPGFVTLFFLCVQFGGLVQIF